MRRGETGKPSRVVDVIALDDNRSQRFMLENGRIGFFAAVSDQGILIGGGFTEDTDPMKRCSSELELITGTGSVKLNAKLAFARGGDIQAVHSEGRYYILGGSGRRPPLMTFSHRASIGLRYGAGSGSNYNSVLPIEEIEIVQGDDSTDARISVLEARTTTEAAALDAIVMGTSLYVGGFEAVFNTSRIPNAYEKPFKKGTSDIVEVLPLHTQ